MCLKLIIFIFYQIRLNGIILMLYHPVDLLISAWKTSINVGNMFHIKKFNSSWIPES